MNREQWQKKRSQTTKDTGVLQCVSGVENGSREGENSATESPSDFATNMPTTMNLLVASGYLPPRTDGLQVTLTAVGVPGNLIPGRIPISEPGQDKASTR